MALDAKVLDTLSNVSTATLTTVLLKKGLRNVWMRGNAAAATESAARGRAGVHDAIRSAREDRRLRSPGPLRSTRAAIEEMPEGCIAVVDAMGITDAGIFGDILCARINKRGVRALITDGVVRDLVGVLATGLPVWCQGVAAPPSVAGLTFVNWQEPIGCGGVAVFPNDIIVSDEDGAVVIPQAMLDDMVATAPEQERFEAWVVSEVERGEPLPGLYPPNAETKARYQKLSGE